MMRSSNLMMASAIFAVFGALAQPRAAQHYTRPKAAIGGGKAKPEQSGNRQRLAEKAARRRERQS